MKTQQILNVLFTLALVALLCLQVQEPAEKECCNMPVEFDGNNYIQFDGLTTIPTGNMSISVWVYVTGFPVSGYGGIVRWYNAALGQNREWLTVLDDGGTYNNAVQFANKSGSADGTWIVNNVFSLSTWTNITVTYNDSSKDNDPTIYINGVDTALTVDTNNTNVASVADPLRLVLGSTGASYRFYGQQNDFRIYNLILTADEVLDIYNSKSYDSVPRGLVFQMRGYGCAGGQTFDGMVLGAANTVVDYVGGAIGTPAGNPIGRADNLLSCNP